MLGGLIGAWALLCASAVPAAADDTPAAAFPHKKAAPLAVLANTDQLEARSRGEVSIRATKDSSCQLTFAGPGSQRSGPYRVRMRRRYATWQWRVPHTVRGGLWRARVVCRHNRHTRSKTVRILVALTRANRSSVVVRGSMKVKMRRAIRQPGADSHGGKGAGRYPNDNARCKWPVHNGFCPYYDWGYPRADGGWSLLSSRGFAYRNCTDFVAWFMGLSWSAFHFPGGNGNAVAWRAAAGNVGLQVTSHPSVGDIAWWGREKAGGLGHVAVVTAVTGGDRVTIAECNGDGQGHYDVRPNVRADAYLHRPTPPRTAPVTATPAPNASAPTVPPPAGSAPATTTPASTPTPTPTKQPQPAPRTWSEQQGHHGVNTFTNPYNASGLGPKIAPAAWIKVSCKVYAPQIASANPDGYWYRIASSPWNDRYYSPANTFMNGDPWNGPYSHNTDLAVPNC